MSFANFGSSRLSSQAITLTKAPDLEPYQVFQLREKLIKLGFTPNSVKQKSDCSENNVIPQFNVSVH